MRLLVTGGGTGGHIYPAISVALKFKEKHANAKILYVGRTEGLESEILSDYDIEYRSIPITYLKNKKIKTVIKYLISLIKAFFISRKIIKEFKPDVVFGTGGYVTGPVLMSAQMMKVKTVLHESNAFPGRANRFFSKRADFVFVSYKEAKKRFKRSDNVIFSGTPIRKEFEMAKKDKSREKLGISDDEFLVVSLGGSGGAERINEIMMELIKKVSEVEKLRYIHVTGKSYYNIFMKRQMELDIKFGDNITILPYIDDMATYMSAADLLITRGGALTLAEVKVVKTPAIIIPSPNVKDNHQEHNANALVKKGLAFMIKESELNYFTLYEKIIELMNKPKILSDMRMEMKKNSENDCASMIVRNITKIAK